MPPHTKGFSFAVEEPWPPGTGAAFAPLLWKKRKFSVLQERETEGCFYLKILKVHNDRTLLGIGAHSKSRDSPRFLWMECLPFPPVSLVLSATQAL